MVSYNNSNVVQCVRQYGMFADSLNLVKTTEERKMIIKQLTKLEQKIIDLTNEIYVEEYYTLANKECGLIDEERTRLNMLIELINQRLSYIEKRCNNHYQLTGETIDLEDVLGADTLDSLEERIVIIDKYSKNAQLEEELNKEVESLTNKITLAAEKIEINKSLNQELEKSFCELLSDSFEKLGFYELFDNKETIEFAYYETEKSLTLAELNLESAKMSSLNVLEECKELLDSVKADYVKYKEKINILKLMDVFNKEVSDYEELIEKRKEINELFRYIKNEDFLRMVTETVTKQYNTILLEQQDVNTYNELILERDRKLDTLAEINEENNSERFRNVLEELIKNEEAKQARILEEKRKLEEEENKKRLEIERKKREEVLKRQKIIEDARKKEIEKRTKLMLEQQQNSILQTNKKETVKDIPKREVSFESIKDDIVNEEVPFVKEEVDTSHEEVLNNVVLDENSTSFDENIIFKNKIDIEKELFDEFNGTIQYSVNFDEDTLTHENVKEEIKEEESKFPDMSIDEYMKNFDENNIEEPEVGSLFNDDDMFPSIPM